jgi:hypothetical protein
MRFVVIEEWLRVIAQTEEVAALLDALDWLLMNRAEVAFEQLLLGLERLASDAVPIFVVIEIDMKPSWAQPSSSQARRNGAAIRSTNSCGARPSSLARRSIFNPCSSSPVRKYAGLPRRRAYRDTTSAATVE